MNLISDSWIQCSIRGGALEELGIEDTLTRAPEISDISGEVPTQVFAIMRMLIAFLSRSVGGPTDDVAWRALWDSHESAVPSIRQYAQRHWQRFALFGDHPFMQVATLHTAKGEFSHVSKIIADVPDGHQFFATRAGDGLDRLSCAEAARWLVHTQAFDPSGIKSGAIGDERVKGGKGYPIGTGWCGSLGGLLVEGENLWETLLLNLPPANLTTVEPDARDLPVWEQEPHTAAESPLATTGPPGPVSLLTWQSRRIRLIAEGDHVTGVLVANGDRIEPVNRHLVERMTAWRLSKPQAKKHGLAEAYMPRTHTPGRALWRGLAAILPTAAMTLSTEEHGDTASTIKWASHILDELGEDRLVQIRAMGISYGSNNSVISEIIDDRLDVPLTVLAEKHPTLVPIVLRAVERTDREAVFALKNLASNLARADGADSEQLLEGRRDRAAEAAYAQLDPIFRAWLAGLGSSSSPTTALDEYNRAARGCLLDIGRRLVDDAGPHALVGRLVSGPKKDSDPRRLSAPLAESWYRSAIYKALPTSDDRRVGEAV